ncbi:MAG: DUF3549 family protein [Idiomarina sp.]|nr:DUF3549 family protein [Idiomarina sp.]
MSSITNLSEFLSASGVKWHVFNLSRQVRMMPQEQFVAIEQGQQPFPAPRQQHAWLGVLFWREESQTPFVWFVKLPLDERGVFQHAALQHFLSIIVEALGQNPTANPSQAQESLLQQNPYIFQPDEHRRAAFHAKAALLLDQPASIHFEAAEAFLSGQTDADWRDLAIQGLHDVAARSLSSTKVQRTISQDFVTWPEPFQQALAQTLEHHELPNTLAQNLIGLLQQEAHASAPPLRENLLRSLTSMSNTAALQKSLLQLLKLEHHDANTLILIAARHAEALADNVLFKRFMQSVAASDEQLFSQLFKELVMIPSVRMHCLSLLHTPEQPEAIQRGINCLVQSVRGKV